ncbi:hypothetical protein GOBAR_AA23688 [Gossypium barbadense]|uniref:Uncharacterized protein n=1 Tax=Gossypium barbadense TaxID=3634 RepID=A0A2P5X0Z0_GOSBA|nr:hypothetical protein GOBAR_AA23688 [Gossypium barbadense]
MVQPTVHEMSLKEVHEPFSSNSRGPIHEERRLQIEELDEWRTHKSRTHDKPKLRQNELNTFPNQLKLGDRVLVDAVDPHIVTTKPNEEVPLTVLGIFPFSTVEVSHPKFGTFTMSSLRGKKTAIPVSKKRKGVSSSTGPTVEIRHPLLQFPIGPQEELFQILRARPLVQFRFGDLVCQLSVLEFGIALGQRSSWMRMTSTLSDATSTTLPRNARRQRALAMSALRTPTFYGAWRMGMYFTSFTLFRSPFATKWSGIGGRSSPLSPT